MRSPTHFLIVTLSVVFFVTSIFFHHFFRPSIKVLSVSPNIVISEIQVRSVADADDEFVELYNPSGSEINLTSWKLTKKTQTGTQTNLIASMSGIIPAKGYFLVTSPESLSSSSADQLYSTAQHVAADNTVILISNDGTTVIDFVGLGTATASETASIPNPVNSGSVERKAQSSSTTSSMSSGGLDEFSGNGWDTDNNSLDFIQRVVSHPQNSHSDTEPLTIPTPTETVTPTPTVTPTNTPTPTETPTPTNTPPITPTETVTPTVTPTPTPTSTPIPTETVTPTPSTTPTPTETASPSPTPTNTPTTTVTPSPTMTSSPTLTPTPTSTTIPTPTPTSVPHTPFPFFSLLCTTTPKIIVTPIGVFHFLIPSCRVVRIN